MILRQITVSFKDAFSGLLFRKEIGARVFQWQEETNVVVIIALSSTKPCLNFLKFLPWAEIFWEAYFMSVKSTSFCHEIWWKRSISRVKQIKRNSRHGFVDKRQVKTIQLTSAARSISVKARKIVESAELLLSFLNQTITSHQNLFPWYYPLIKIFFPDK